MSDLKEKIRVRAGHKAYVTKTISEVGKVIGCGGEVYLRKLRSLQSILRDKLTEMKALDREIVEEMREARKTLIKRWQTAANSQLVFTNALKISRSSFGKTSAWEKKVRRQDPNFLLMDRNQINRQRKGRSSSPIWN